MDEVRCFYCAESGVPNCHVCRGSRTITYEKWRAAYRSNQEAYVHAKIEIAQAREYVAQRRNVSENLGLIDFWQNEVREMEEYFGKMEEFAQERFGRTLRPII